MILKLKVYQDPTTLKHVPSPVFHASEFVDQEDMNSLLSSVYLWINQHKIHQYIRNTNEIHFNVETCQYGYVNRGPISKTEFSKEDMIASVCFLAGLDRDVLFSHCRDRKLVLARATLFCALLHFGNYTFSAISRDFKMNHATIMHLRYKTIPSAILDRDAYVVGMVSDLAQKYGDHRFVDFCKMFGAYKKLKTTTKEPCAKSGYHGVYRDRGYIKMKWRSVVVVNKKQKMLGVFDDAKQAARVYNEFVVSNGLKSKLNKV